jgi:hypothetical protein
MRSFLVGALCAVLIGCGCPLPPRGVVQTCTSQGCFTRTAATTPIGPKRAPFRPEPAMKAKKVAIAAKPAAARPPNEAGPVEEKENSRTIMESEVPPPAQFSATPDPAPKSVTTTIGGEDGRPGNWSALRDTRSCSEKSKDHGRGENGESGICRIHRYETGHEREYIRPTLRGHLRPRQRQKEVG